MLGNKRIAHTIHYHLVAGLLLVCMAGIGESAYAQEPPPPLKTMALTIDFPTTTGQINEEGETSFEFEVVFHFINPIDTVTFPSSLSTTTGTLDNALNAEIQFAGSSIRGGRDRIDPRVTPMQDYKIEVDGVEQTPFSVRNSFPIFGVGRLDSRYGLNLNFGPPRGAIGSVAVPANGLRKTIRLTAKDDGVDEGADGDFSGGPPDGIEGISISLAHVDVDLPTPPDPNSGGTLLTQPGRRFVLILDNDDNPPGVTIMPTTLTTTEGGTATFTVVLDTEPAGFEVHTENHPISGAGGINAVSVYELTNEVRVTVTSGDVNEGLVSSGSSSPAMSTILTFTDDVGATPWNMPQTVTVTGVTDTTMESDMNYDITFGVDGGTFAPGSLSRPDNDYDGVTVPALSVTNEDFSAGISVHDAMTDGNQIRTATIDEASSADTLYVQLVSAPTSTVTMTVMSSNTNEGTVTPGTLTFTATNWNSRQALTVTAVPDDIDRDDTFTVDFVITAGSGDYDPATLTIPSVTVTVTDDDTAGIALFDMATGADVPSITTTEGATTDTFYVLLESEPTAEVTVMVTSGDPGEGTITTGASLTFDSTNWDTPRQMVTVTGVNDDVVDGDQTYDITLTPTGGGYGSVTAPTVSVTNSDDDTAALSIADMSVNENAGTATVTVTLSAMVTAGPVTVDLTTTDGTATTAGADYTAFISETLTIAEGSTTQTLDIPINNDNIDETDETFTVTLDNLMLPAAVTGDVTITDATATITITDDDTLSDTINLSVSPLTVAEIADATTITVTATIDGTAVSTMPTTVTVSVGGGTATSGTDYAAVTDFTLTIPAESASGMATFMIDPTDDTADDNNETVMITGTAPGFTTVTPATLTIVEAGISVHDAMTAGNPITTATIAEASGTDMLYVQLASQPATSSSVVIGVTSSDMNEGTVNMAALTFTDATWNIRQPVTVTAVPDNIDDDDTFTVDFAITSGDSANYTTSLTLPSVTVTVTDDDTVSNTINLSISPPSIAETAASTEITVTATIGGTVVLPMPTTVTVSVGGGTATSGTDYAAVTGFTLTIPAESASGMATFMIDPTDDTTDDNNETVMITGTAPGFTTINPATLTIVEAGISVHDAMTAGNPITTATIAEASGTGMLYVQLASQPATSSSVVIGVTSSDMNEGTVNMAALTFTDATWNIRQPVTVTAVPDNIDDDDTFTVDFAITSGDSANYTTSLTLPSVTVTVTDDDTVSNTINLSISPPSIAETAASTEITVTATIGGTVVLPMPTTVTVSVGGGTATSGTDYAAVTGFTLTIPAESASGMATFMIDPTDDTTDDNNETVMITGTAPGFTTVTPATLNIVEAGISVHDAMTAGNPITTATIAEASGTDMLYVQLASQPATSSSVVIGVTSSDMNEGTVNMAALTFTDATWNIRQPVTVTAVPDNIDDDDTFTVDFAITSGDSANYTTSLTLPSVTVTVTDDDTVSNTINLSISPPSIAETAASTEITVTATIGGTVVLPMPTTVTVSVGGGTATSGTDYAAVTGFTLTIPAESASGMATFMIDPTDDTTDDNNETVMITGTAPGFTTVTPATLNIVEAGISVHDAMTAGNPITTATIAEASGTDMLYVQLASQPAGNVTLSVESDDPNEGTVSTPTLTFSDTNWDTRQLITVTAVPDNIDRDDTFMVDFAVMSGTGNYDPGTLTTLPSVTVTITDDDTVSDTINLSVSPLSVAETADATTITVTATIGGTAVSTMPTAVTVSVGGGTATVTTDYTATPATLTITIPAEMTSGNGVFSMTPVADDESDTEETITISGIAGGFTVNSATLTIIEGLNTEQREALHGELLGVANQATMQVMVDVLSKRLKPRARTTAHGSVAGHVLGLGEWQDADWQKRLSLAVYSTLQRLDDGGALLVPVDATTFDNSEFALPLEVGESVVVLWGALGSSTVTGGQSDASDYDGDLIAVLLGIDSMIGEHARLGIAASYEHSELDYQLDMTSGDVVQTMTGIQPYLSWQPHDSVALWLMGGYGFGDYDATESTAGGTTLRAEDADVERWMAALGFHYVHRFGSSGWDMVLNNKALWNRTVRDEARFDDGSLLPKNVSANWRARLESEVGYSWTFGDGSLRPYGLASVRWDGGDVVNDDTTFMVDAGGGVELSFASRLSMDFKVRRQVTDGDHEEHNVIAVGSFGFAEHEDGQGWQVALERSLLGGLRAPDHNKAGFDFEQSDSTPTIGQSPSLQANVGYGRLINPLTDAKAGLLKTYTRFYLDPDENKRHAVGLGFDFASLQVGVESEYNNGELETLLRGHIDF